MVSGGRGLKFVNFRGISSFWSRFQALKTPGEASLGLIYGASKRPIVGQTMVCYYQKTKKYNWLLTLQPLLITHLGPFILKQPGAIRLASQT